MYLIAFPLLLIPFALYNMVAFLLNMPFTETVLGLSLLSRSRARDIVLEIPNNPTT